MPSKQTFKATALVLLATAARVFAQQDGAVSLTVHLADHPPLFHVGEVIPLELVFSASGSEAYEFDTRNYDRSGRLGIEQFHVAPEGRDPLQAYYARGAFFGGGLGSANVLNDKPQTMHNDLNEWVALDHPGHYTLYVTSGRVTQKFKHVELRSNTLGFDVVTADEEWQNQTLRAAVVVLDSNSSSAEEKKSAIRALRFLDSAASVPELVRQLGRLPEGERWDCIAGLWSSSHRSLVVETLERQMADPDTPLNQDYLHALAEIKFHLDHGLPTPCRESDQKLCQEQAQSEMAELDAANRKLAELASSLTAKKRGEARAETVRAVLQMSANNPLPDAEVAAAFSALSSDDQYRMLAESWERVKVRAMVEPLKKVLRQPQISNQQLRDEAFKRLYELDPEQAAAQILAEIRDPHTEGGMSATRVEVLGRLPNETLPQFDELLARRLEQKNSGTLELDSQLVGRYSSASILNRIKAVYSVHAGQWDCQAEDGFLLYFLRVEPDYGVKRLIASAGFCMDKSLAALVKINRWGEIEPSVIQHLNDPVLHRARVAAETLAKYGGPKAEEAMWNRLRRFHEQWADQEEELTTRPGASKEGNDAAGFQFGLVEALGHAQAWILTNPQVDELEGLTLGQERENVKRWHWNSPVGLTVTFFLGEKLQAQINEQFFAADISSLRKKLAQYPEGTRFHLTTSGTPEQLAPVMQAIHEVADAHGLVTFQDDPESR